MRSYLNLPGGEASEFQVQWSRRKGIAVAIGTFVAGTCLSNLHALMEKSVNWQNPGSASTDLVTVVGGSVQEEINQLRGDMMKLQGQVNANTAKVDAKYPDEGQCVLCLSCGSKWPRGETAIGAHRVMPARTACGASVGTSVSVKVGDGEGPPTGNTGKIVCHSRIDGNPGVCFPDWHSGKDTTDLCGALAETSSCAGDNMWFHPCGDLSVEEHTDHFYGEKCSGFHPEDRPESDIKLCCA